MAQKSWVPNVQKKKHRIRRDGEKAHSQIYIYINIYIKREREDIKIPILKLPDYMSYRV